MTKTLNLFDTKDYKQVARFSLWSGQFKENLHDVNLGVEENSTTQVSDDHLRSDFV